MKRHASLQPFSRDHNNGLILARQLEEAADDAAKRQSAVQSLREGWDLEMADHFLEEERLLAELIDEEAKARLLREHASIRDKVAAVLSGVRDPELFRILGAEIHNHIRWEERELFPSIEGTASEEQLRALGLITDQVEDRHGSNGLSPRRAELMKRKQHGG